MPEIPEDVKYYFILIGGTFLFVFIATYLLRKGLNAIILRNTDTLKTDPTNFIFLKNSISFVLYTVAIFWVFHKIPYFKSLSTALFASAGVFAALIGFASQKAFSNIIGGLFILLFKPFRVGDIIEISNSRKGQVEEITLRHTVLKDFENRRIIVPNAMISDETILNSSIIDQKIRKHIEIGIDYNSDIDKAIEIIRTEITNHPLSIDVRLKKDKDKNVPAVDIRLISFADSSVILRAYAWSKNFDNAFQMHCEVLYNVKKQFDLQGIVIPYPHRTIVNKGEIPVKL